MNEIGFERFRIQLIINYPCEDIYQLTQKEGEYIRLMGTLNKRIEGRTKKEYYENNKDKIKEYYENNKDKIKEFQKEWYETNKDKKKEYYEINKNKIIEYKGVKKVCECGCSIRGGEMARHMKTKKHIKLMQQLNNTSNNEVVV